MRQERSGYTLLELVFSISILAFLVLSIGIGIRALTSKQTDEQTKAKIASRSSEIQQRLTDDIGRAVHFNGFSVHHINGESAEELYPIGLPVDNTGTAAFDNLQIMAQLFGEIDIQVSIDPTNALIKYARGETPNGSLTAEYISKRDKLVNAIFTSKNYFLLTNLDKINLVKKSSTSAGTCPLNYYCINFVKPQKYDSTEFSNATTSLKAVEKILWTVRDGTLCRLVDEATPLTTCPADSSIALNMVMLHISYKFDRVNSWSQTKVIPSGYFRDLPAIESTSYATSCAVTNCMDWHDIVAMQIALQIDSGISSDSSALQGGQNAWLVSGGHMIFESTFSVDPRDAFN